MVRILVIALLAGNLLLAGFRVAGETGEPFPGADAPEPLPAGLPSIQLASELPAPPPAQGPALHCHTVGPFETEEGMWRAHAALDRYTVELRQRETEALMELGYWVALPPFATFADAGEALRGLKAAGLTDVAVVNNEPGEFHVSLGYFLEEANARRRRDAVRALGFEAVTRLQRETQIRWWLDYAQPAQAAPAAELLADVLAAGLHREIPCAGELAQLDASEAVGPVE